MNKTPQKHGGNQGSGMVNMTSAEHLILRKLHPDSSCWSPLETGTASISHPRAARLLVSDAARRVYVDALVGSGKEISFAARGTAGRHLAELLADDGSVLSVKTFTLRAETRLSCNRGPYAELGRRIGMLLQQEEYMWRPIINGKQYFMFVCWGRDHVHTLKAQKYFQRDVTSGLEYWLEVQEENGMLWDCIYPNPNYPSGTWLGEALGEGYFRYDDNKKYIVRRIPVEADCEFMYTEGVWYTWKATGDDDWMAKQLPVLERALTYNNSDPTRWSGKHGLVRRSMCMDSWDFVNPLFCNGDHRCINPGDPQFLFHSDNSGLYASYWRMAEMYEALGNTQRAGELRAEGEELRTRANAKLFFDTNYGHMIPEELPDEEFYAKVGDERKRMSLSTGYTINRKLPTHEMAVKIIQEYQRRYAANKHDSFAEWWTMDPPYSNEQWPYASTGGSTSGEYMNGAICTIIAGELAKAAFDHGFESYGADILDRVWKLSERDHGELYQVYRRLPEHPVMPAANFQPVDLRAVANRALRVGATPGLKAWTDEGDNDMRNLPVGRQNFGAIGFDVIDPAANSGRAVLFVDRNDDTGVIVPVPAMKGKSLYFLHAAGTRAEHGAVIGLYDVSYADGTVERVHLRNGNEIANWWGPQELGGLKYGGPIKHPATRLAWNGPNGTHNNVGMYMFGWNNPHAELAVTAIRFVAVPSACHDANLMLAAISFSDRAVQYEERIRSHGLPDSWSQAAVFYAVAEGLAGIEDAGRAFDRVRVSPRWAASQANEADIILHYPASDGYCSYRYRDDNQGKLTLELTGSLERAEIHCLLPKGKTAKRVNVDAADVAFANVKVETSNYADFVLESLPRGLITIDYAA